MRPRPGEAAKMLGGTLAVSLVVAVGPMVACGGSVAVANLDATAPDAGDATRSAEGGDDVTSVDGSDTGSSFDGSDATSSIDSGDAMESFECGDEVGAAEGGDATSSGSEAGDSSVMFPDASCVPPLPVDDSNLQQCTSCSNATVCTSAEPLDACCTWVAAPRDALADGIGLHRYSTNVPDAVPDLSCLAQSATPGTPQTVTLTGYVWTFASGQDTAGVEVDVYAENHPQTPDGTIGATPLGTYTTSTSDPIDPTDTTWDSKCASGCSFRRYTIANVPTETPLVLVTGGAGSVNWATRYEYNVYFSNSAVHCGRVSYDATAIAGADVSSIAGTIGQTLESGNGVLLGEVHDCSDIRLSGAAVETNQSHEGPLVYLTDDESDPLPSFQGMDTGTLGAFVALNMQAGIPTRVTAVGQCPPNAAAASPPICNQGEYVMLGTYVVQMYSGAVTALSLRGRRPWQP